MAAEPTGKLLTADEPPAVRVHNPQGGARFLLVGDHAGAGIPLRLGTLGLSEADRTRHIALDIGVAALGARLAAMLDAPFIAQAYSRLVIDCNRALDDPGSIASSSDGTTIPGNAGLTTADRAARVSEVRAPYHAAIANCLAARTAVGRPTVLIALHSFTPMMTAGGTAGQVRPWEIGVLHDAGDARFALALLAGLQALPDRCIGDNEPYRMDGTDYTVPWHAYPAMLPYAEIEVRQDLIADDAGVEEIADVLASSLQAASTSFESLSRLDKPIPSRRDQPTGTF